MPSPTTERSVVEIPEDAVEAVAQHIAANDGHGHWHLVEHKRPYLNAAAALIVAAQSALEAAFKEEIRGRVETLRVYNDEQIAARRGPMEGWVRRDDVLAAIELAEAEQS